MNNKGVYIKRSIKFFFFSLLFFLFVGPVISQDSNSYDVIQKFKLSDDSLAMYANRLKNMKPSWEQPDRKLNIAYKNICKRRANYLTKLNKSYLLMDNNLLTTLLQGIADQLIKNNPSVFHNEYKVYINRSSSVNAFNLGEGIIVVNMGLLVRVKNVEEIAFVIAHEMGHDVLSHVRKISEQTALLQTDKDFENKLKEASKKEYGSYSSYKEIVYKKAIETSLHSRINEFSADSCGAQICNNAGIENKFMYQTLTMLKNSDNLLFDDTLDIKNVLSTSGFEIDEESLLDDELLNESWGASDDLSDFPDSLRSHPNCDDRIAYIKSMKFDSSNLDNNHYWEETSRLWNLNKQNVINEFLHVLLEENQYDLAGFYGLIIKEKQSDDLFANILVYHCLTEYYISIKEGFFSKIISFPDEELPTNYNNWLTFLHNINSKKVNAILSGYHHDYLANTTDTEFASFSIFYKDYYLMKKLEKQNTKIGDYQNHFYNKKIKQLIIKN